MKIFEIIKPLKSIRNEKHWGRFHDRLKPGFGLKFKTLVLNSVKNVLSQQA